MRIVLKHIFSFILIAATVNSAQGNVVVTTTVKDKAVVDFDCQCPQDENGGAFTVDISKTAEKWNDRQIDEFSEYVDEFEKINVIHITSGIRTDHIRQIKSTLTTNCTGPLDGPGKKLCDFLRKNK